MSKIRKLDTQQFTTPFSKAYWACAVAELKKPRVLVFAAMMIALRVALKSLGIPIAADLRINIAFFINALGAMVFGPVMAILAAAVSDTLGCLLFPTGAYFFPFIFIEIAGSLFFALFLYRAKITPGRVIWSRFCICFFVNIVLNTPIMMLYYKMVLGQSYLVFQLPRVVKNLALFPVESILLALFLRALYPLCAKMHFGYSTVTDLKFTKRSVVLMAVLVAISTGTTVGYAIYDYNTSSLSADYGSKRIDYNNAMNEIVLAETDTWDDAVTVSVVESAYPKFGQNTLTYTVAVYTVDESHMEEEFAIRTEEARLEAEASGEDFYPFDMASLQYYSKTPASKDDLLTREATATIVTDKDSGECLSFSVE